MPLSSISESKTNPRRTFDKNAMTELAESISKHGVLQPILIRPSGTAGLSAPAYELVAGARRYRAAKAAGLKKIPVFVRDLDDKEALEVQVIENLQREDLHPLEEAEGYRQLRELHGYEAAELAAKVGKSKAYIYARLKLCDLSPKAQTLFRKGKLDASRALLIARIPVASLQDEAAEEITDEDGWSGPMSHRDASDYVQRTFMLRLKDAPFKSGDEKLLPKAGSCRTCEKRTGAQPQLFGDIEGKDVCTDPTCFEEKVEAQWKIIRAKAEKEGNEIIEGDAAKNVRYSGKYVTLDDLCLEDPKRRTWRKLLKDTKAPHVVMRDPRSNNAVEMVKKAAAFKELEAGHTFATKGSSSGTTSNSDAKLKAAHKKRVAAIAATVGDMVTKVEALEAGTVFLRFIVESLLRGHAEPVNSVNKRRGTKLAVPWSGYGRKPTKATVATLDEMTTNQLRGLAVELIVMDGASAVYSGGYGAGWSAACKLFKISMKAREKRIATASNKKPKAKSKKPAKKKGKA